MANHKLGRQFQNTIVLSNYHSVIVSMRDLGEAIKFLSGF